VKEDAITWGGLYDHVLVK